MVIFHFAEDQITLLGLQLAGFTTRTIATTNAATNEKRLKDFCYAGSKSITQILNDVQDDSLGEFKIAKPNPSHLIWALYFLKKYPTAHDFSARCGDGTEKTVLTRAWRYVRAIQALKERKIQWIFGEEDVFDEYFIISVDGVHFRIHEPRTQPSSGWYSKKHNGAGLVYEIGLAIQTNKIVWINGPFPAGQNDMKVFRKELMSKIPANCRAIGDDGYRGEPLKVSTKNVFNSDKVKKFSSRVRARHETVNSRLTAFEALDQEFRSKGSGRMPKHKSVFEACCVIVQYEMDNGSHLFKV